MPDYTSIHTGPVIDQGVSDGLTAVQPADLATVATSGDYTDLINIPATFTPSAHNHVATDITDFTEAVGDAVNGLLVAGTNVSFSYNDVANTFTINATGGGVTDGDKGDITVSASGVTWTIDNGVVSLAKMANMDTARILGRDTAGSGAPEALTPSAVRGIINVADGATANASDASLRDRSTHTGTQAVGTITGLAAVATSGSASDLGVGTLPAARFDDTAHGSRAGGSLHANVVAAGAAGFMTGADKTKLDAITGTNTGDQTITLTGEVTGSGTGSFAATIANDSVTNAKAANMAVNTIKGRVTSGTGDPEDLTPAQARTVIEVPKITVGTTAPVSPSVGDVWIDTN